MPEDPEEPPKSGDRPSEADETIVTPSRPSGRTPLESSPPAEDSSAVGATIGRYRIVEKIGEGGMGVVYEAEQEMPRRRVALKRIRGGRLADDLSVRHFQREAEMPGRLEHPGIAAIYEAGREVNQDFIDDLESYAAFLRKAGEKHEAEKVEAQMTTLRAKLAASERTPPKAGG